MFIDFAKRAPYQKMVKMVKSYFYIYNMAWT